MANNKDVDVTAPTNTQPHVDATTPAEEQQHKPSNERHQQQEPPTRRLLHKLFILISVATALVAIWMAAGQVLGIVVYENGPVEYVLCGFVILWCILVMFVEAEWPAFARESAVLHNWIPRGLLYVFLGVIGLQQYETSIVKEEYEYATVARDVLKAVAWNMIGCGLLYVVMGILCLQFLLRRMRKSYQARLELAKTRKRQAKEGSKNNDVEAPSDEAAHGDDDDDDELEEGNDTFMEQSDESHQDSAAPSTDEEEHEASESSSADDDDDVEA